MKVRASALKLVPGDCGMSALLFRGICASLERGYSGRKDSPRRACAPVSAFGRSSGSSKLSATEKPGLWTRTCCGSQTRVAQRSLVLSTVARERSRRRVIVLCISSKDAYRSSAGRDAHCRLACIRVVIVLSFRLSRAGMPSTPCARTGAQPGGRSLSEAADGFGDKLMPLKLVHALQAMSDGDGSVSERAFRDHARDPLLLARQGTALQVSV